MDPDRLDHDITVSNIKISQLTNRIMLIDSEQGLYSLNIVEFRDTNNFVLECVYQFGDMERSRFRDACFCFDYQKKETIAMVSNLQTHQTLSIIPLVAKIYKSPKGDPLSKFKVGSHSEGKRSLGKKIQVSKFISNLEKGANSRKGSLNQALKNAIDQNEIMQEEKNQILEDGEAMAEETKPKSIEQEGDDSSSSEEPDEILTLEILDSKVKAKTILFNPLWNCFFLRDSDEHLWMLEFYPPVYFESFWTNYEYAEQNEYYVETEDEFDKPVQSQLIPYDKLSRFRGSAIEKSLKNRLGGGEVSESCGDGDLLLAVINNGY